MIGGTAVSNSSPLIALHQIGKLELLRDLFDSVHIPPAVAAEAGVSVRLPSWIHLQRITTPAVPSIVESSIGAGELEALHLGIEMRADWVIVDDLRARKLADQLDVRVAGTLRILSEAKQAGLIDRILPLLDQLVHFEFRVSTLIYEQILRSVGE